MTHIIISWHQVHRHIRFFAERPDFRRQFRAAFLVGIQHQHPGIPALFGRKPPLRVKPHPFLRQHFGMCRMMARNLAGLIRRAGIDHHDILAPRQGIERRRDPAGLVTADDAGGGVHCADNCSICLKVRRMGLVAS